MNRMDFFYLQLRHVRTKIHEIRMDIALAIGHIGDIVKWAKIHGFYMDLADRALRNNEEAHYLAYRVWNDVWKTSGDCCPIYELP